MNEVGKLQRIKELMLFLGLTQTAMAAKIGMTQSNFSGVLSGRRPCGNGVIDKLIISFPQLNREWLLTGEGEMLRKIHSTPTISGDITITDVSNSSIGNVGHGNNYTPACDTSKRCKCALYPVLPKEVIRALDTNIEKWKEQNLDKCKVVDLRELIGEVSHAQYMIGRAMEPNIPEGTLLFLREINEWDEALLDGTIYAVDVARPHMIVRKVYDDGEFIRCQPVNPEFEAVRIPKDKVMNLYKISSGWKKFD